MGRLAQRVESARAVRDAARGAFDLRLARVREDLDARGVGGRIADQIGQDAREAFDEAIEVADQNRGVVAGTIAALAIWLFRHPIIAAIEGLMGLSNGANDEEEAGHDQD
jgi:hypothetical protein